MKRQCEGCGDPIQVLGDGTLDHHRLRDGSPCDGGGPLTATESHLKTIRLRAYDEDARAMERNGVRLTHDQADALGDMRHDWLRTTLGLQMSTDDRWVMFLPRAEVE